MTSCNYETDYSTVIGERILPFGFFTQYGDFRFNPKIRENTSDFAMILRVLEQTHLSMQT